MTKDAIENHHAIDRLAASLVDDILNMTDAELLAELQADGEDVKKYAQASQDAFDRARATCGKARLATAKKAVLADKQRIPERNKINPDQVRRRLNETLNRHPESCGTLTLAARKSDGLSDNDILAILDGLKELGVASQEKNEDDET